MNYNTVFVGMEVQKESFTFCAYTIDAEKGSHFQRTEADYKNVLKLQFTLLDDRVHGRPLTCR